MEISFVWACANCKEEKRPPIVKNIKEELPRYIQKYQVPPAEVSIRLTCSDPFTLDGEAVDNEGKVIVVFTYSLLQKSERTYRHWTVPLEAKP